MVTNDRVDVKLKRQDCMRDVCTDIKLLLETLGSTIVSDLTILHFLSKMTIKLLGDLGAVYFVYIVVFHRSSEI